MSLAIANGDLLSARVWWTLGNQAAVCTLNYACVSHVGASATDQDFATAMDVNLSALWRSLVPPGVVYNGTQVYFRYRGAGVFLPAPVKGIGASGVGTATLGNVPRNACLMMKYSTVIRGPGGRGRLYFPFVSNDYVAADGEPNNAYAVLVNSAASNFLNPLVIGGGGNTATLVWSLFRNHKGTYPTVTGQIVNAEASDKIGQMHKRGDFGRANASPI